MEPTRISVWTWPTYRRRFCTSASSSPNSRESVDSTILGKKSVKPGSSGKLAQTWRSRLDPPNQPLVKPALLWANFARGWFYYISKPWRDVLHYEPTSTLRCPPSPYFVFEYTRIVAEKLTAVKPVFLAEQHGMGQSTCGGLLTSLTPEALGR